MLFFVYLTSCRIFVNCEMNIIIMMINLIVRLP